jgi:hypothetical protein
MCTKESQLLGSVITDAVRMRLNKPVFTQQGVAAQAGNHLHVYCSVILSLDLRDRFYFTVQPKRTGILL